jgi:hypothetical protein
MPNPDSDRAEQMSNECSGERTRIRKFTYSPDTRRILSVNDAEPEDPVDARGVSAVLPIRMEDMHVS